MHACRTACRYGGKSIAFHVNEGSTSFWLSLLVEFEDGDGDIGSMQLKQVITLTHQCKLVFSFTVLSIRPRHVGTMVAYSGAVQQGLFPQ